MLEVLKYLHEAKQTKFSVEVEKVGRGFEDFIPFADIVFVSKVRETADYCRPLQASAGHCRLCRAVFNTTTEWCLTQLQSGVQHN